MGVYNNFKPVASANHRSFGTYQFVYFDTNWGSCKNAQQLKILPVICILPKQNENTTPFNKMYLIPIIGFIGTLLALLVPFIHTVCHDSCCLIVAASEVENRTDLPFTSVI